MPRTMPDVSSKVRPYAFAVLPFSQDNKAYTNSLNKEAMVAFVQKLVQQKKDRQIQRIALEENENTAEIKKLLLNEFDLSACLLLYLIDFYEIIWICAQSNRLGEQLTELTESTVSFLKGDMTSEDYQKNINALNGVMLDSKFKFNKSHRLVLFTGFVFYMAAGVGLCSALITMTGILASMLTPCALVGVLALMTIAAAGILAGVMNFAIDKAQQYLLDRYPWVESSMLIHSMQGIKDNKNAMQTMDRGPSNWIAYTFFGAPSKEAQNEQASVVMSDLLENSTPSSVFDLLCVLKS